MKNLLYILCLMLFFALGCIAIECTHKPITAAQDEPKEIIKEKIVEKEKEVIKWKEKKGKIIYRTKFDTLATIDTLYIELIKCDSIVKIDSIIIADQDTIIKDQKQVINIVEKSNESLKKDLKKEKRKSLLTKIGAGVAIIITIILSHTN